LAGETLDDDLCSDISLIKTSSRRSALVVSYPHRR